MDINNVKAKAEKCFAEDGLFCAESVLVTLAEEMAVESPLIPRIATGFCGGISRTRGLCGAVAGGVMVLGIAYGRDSAEQSQEKVYAKVQQFMRAFEDEYKSTNCLELTGCDLSTEEGRQAFADTGIKLERCTRFTGGAAALVAEIINDEEAG